MRVFLRLYVLAHLTNHAAALQGIDTHIAFMQALRHVTRVPALEALLLAGVALQAASGLWMILRRNRQGPPRRLLFDDLQRRLPSRRPAARLPRHVFLNRHKKTPPERGFFMPESAQNL